MNILILGNGFDLAHGLPTKYTDFLDWIKKYYEFYSYATRKRTAGYKESNEFILQYFNNLFYDESNKDVCDEIYNLVHENMWIDYFLENPMYQKENWIDFESEISRVIQALDFDMSGGLIHYGLDDNMDKLSNEFLNKRYSVYSYAVRSVSALAENHYESITFRQIRDRLQKDLERLIRALELYLTDYVGKMECKLISPDIKNIAVTINENSNGEKGAIISKVLCFNYTSTYERIYVKKESLRDSIDYIHGKAGIINTIELNNMVLGIDEYLADDRKNRDIEFIGFKKFYQRIHKETGCKYKEWVDKIQEDASHFDNTSKYILNKLTAGKNDGKYEQYKKMVHHLYIFGHSLDVTDGDILRDLILNDNVYTTIYYLNKDIMRQQIANLVKVIGQNELIRRTGGNTKTIEFRQQQNMVER